MPWSFLYVHPETTLVEQFVGAEIDQIFEEITGESYCTFKVPKTQSAIYLAYLVKQGYSIDAAAFFPSTSGAPQFAGIICGVEATPKFLFFKMLDSVILQLDRSEPYSGVFVETPADQMLLQIFEELELEVSVNEDCPSTELDVVFYNANPLDIVKFVADSLGLEYWGSGGDTVNIGARGLNEFYIDKEFVIVDRNIIDSSKHYDKVVVRGLNLNGHHIRGVAGTGTHVKTFSEPNACTEEQLEYIAAKKLAELDNSSTGQPASFLISESYFWQVGDYVQFYKPDYLYWSNSQRIMQITKTKSRVTVQLDRLKESAAKTISDLRRWEEAGIYLPGCTSWSINMQGLLGLYHLNEGEGAIAKNSCKIDTAVDGSIVNGAWEENGYLKYLTFNGSSSYVDCTDYISFAAANAFTVGAWISPVDVDETFRMIAYKDGQFAVGYVGTAIRVTLTEDSTTHTYTTAEGVIKEGGRNAVVVTYDGTDLKIYVNTKLVSQEEGIELTLDESTNKVYIGYEFDGVIGEVMLWQRSLYLQEVIELYFFPLVRVI